MKENIKDLMIIVYFIYVFKMMDEINPLQSNEHGIEYLNIKCEFGIQNLNIFFGMEALIHCM